MERNGDSMKGEIRGLLSGFCFNSEDNVGLEIQRCDGGTSIITIDYELDTFYQFIIDEKGKLVAFDMGVLTDMDF